LIKKKALVASICAILHFLVHMVGTDNKQRGASRKLNVANGNVHKQKLLLPTLKEQQRYVVYRILAEDAFKNLDSNFGKIHNGIIAQCNHMLGIFDGASAGLMNAKYSAEKHSGIIRVNSKYVDKLKICLGLVKNVNGKDVIIDCIFVSGMIGKAIDRMNG